MKIAISILLSIGIALTSQAQTIVTTIGTGTIGFTGDSGLASSADINSPIGLNFDNNGDLIVSLQVFVRKVALATGLINRVAGSDTATGGPTGFGNGGHATCASVARPMQVYVDEHNNYFIADQWSSQIRRIDATTGTITRYAGNGVGSSGDGGPATAARFNTIACEVLDTVGRKLYISDEFNYKVRVIDMTTGIITAFAGTGTSGYTGDGGPATAARFSRVLGLCRDKAGNLYIGDWDNARIRRVDVATGIVTTYAGNGTTGYSGDGGPALSASITKPTSLCMDTCDNMYFTDEDNHVVRRIDAASGIITTVAGSGTAGYSGDGGPALAAQFNHPTGVIIDNDHNLYISDYFNCRVRKMTYVPPTPTVAVTIAPLPNDTVCAGTAVSYTATATGTAPPTYTWYRNGVVVSTTGSTYTYIPTHTDSVRCVATVQVCGVGTAWASSNTIHMVVTPLAMPTISLGGSTAAPLGGTVTVTATVGGAGSSYSIDWYRNGLPLATTTAPLVTYTKTAGTDAITARLSSTAPTGCYDTATSASHTVLVGPNEVGNIATQPMAVTVSPNPAHNSITVSATGGMVQTIAITNLLGQQVVSSSGNDAHMVVPIAHLPKGVYQIRINDLYVQKLIID